MFDKTGTLTKGEFKVSEVVTQNGFNETEIIKFAAYAESHSNHPIAKSIIEAYKNNLPSSEIDESLLSDIQEISGKGIKAKVGGKEIILGNDKLLHIENI